MATEQNERSRNEAQHGFPQTQKREANKTRI